MGGGQPGSSKSQADDHFASQGVSSPCFPSENVRSGQGALAAQTESREFLAGEGTVGGVALTGVLADRYFPTPLAGAFESLTLWVLGFMGSGKLRVSECQRKLRQCKD